MTSLLCALHRKHSRKFYLALTAGLVACLGVFLASGHAHTSYNHTAAEPTMDRPAAQRNKGFLILSGGGDIPRAVRARLYELAGGPKARIVVIPTGCLVDDDAHLKGCLDPWKRFPTASLQVLHTRNRAEADRPAFVKPLTEATGVWICGGYQERLSQVYVGTAVERALRALLARGGVIGGTSAGAAIMTRVMIADGRNKAIVGTGFDLLPGAVVDQHFLARNRAERLLSVLETHPSLTGFGIDEDTALVVDVHDQRAEVLGDSYVFACAPAATGRPGHFEILKPGDEFDTATLSDPDELIIATSDAEQAR